MPTHPVGVLSAKHPQRAVRSQTVPLGATTTEGCLPHTTKQHTTGTHTYIMTIYAHGI